MNTNTINTLVRDIIGKTRFILTDPDHWVKGMYMTHEGAYCSIGAMRKARDLVAEAKGIDAHVIQVAYHEAEIEVAHVRSGLRYRDWAIAQDRIISFNDNVKTGHGDVLALFDKALEATS